MKIFGLTITRTIKPQPMPHQVTITDWLNNQTKPRIMLGEPYCGVTKNERVRCTLLCEDQGNDVSSNAVDGRDVDDAFRKAVIEIEKTIGRGWRDKALAFTPEDIEVRA